MQKKPTQQSQRGQNNHKKPTYTADEVGAASKEVVSKLSEDISDIKQNGTGTGSGATTAQANSLWAFLKKTTFAEPLTDAEINEFKTTWGITEEVEPDTPTTYTITRNLTNCTSSSEVISISEGSAHTETITANNSYTLTGATISVTMGGSDITSSYSNGVLNISSVTGNIVITVSAVKETTEPDNPEVTLTSISATYTGGEVTVGTALTDLTGITVTATYSDGSTANVTDYTLSGEIVEGSNTIAVSYNGKTTTFTVVGVAENSGEDIEPLYTFEDAENVEVSSEHDVYTGLVTVSNGNHVKVAGDSTNSGNYQKWFFGINVSSLESNGATTPTETWFTIPSGASVKMYVKNLSTTGIGAARLGLNSHEAVHGSWNIYNSVSAYTMEFTFTANGDKDIKCVYLDVYPNKNSLFEIVFDVEIYVNETRWI